MLTKSEKEKRNTLKKSYKTNEREKILSNLPVSLELLKSLFNWVGNQLEKQDCDQTFKFTQNFIEQNNLPEDTLLEWLQNQGGYCDCEVLGNVFEQFDN
jgi:hypothetical protein